MPAPPAARHLGDLAALLRLQDARAGAGRQPFSEALHDPVLEIENLALFAGMGDLEHVEAPVPAAEAEVVVLVPGQGLRSSRHPEDLFPDPPGVIQGKQALASLVGCHDRPFLDGRFAAASMQPGRLSR